MKDDLPIKDEIRERAERRIAELPNVIPKSETSASGCFRPYHFNAYGEIAKRERGDG